MATNTGNLGLRKPDPSDEVDVTTDLSDNFDLIDTAVSGKLDSDAAAGGDLAGTYPSPTLSTAKQTELDGKIAKPGSEATGGILAFGPTSWDYLAPGADGTVLRAASGEPLGVEWDTESVPDTTFLADKYADISAAITAVNNAGGGVLLCSAKTYGSATEITSPTVPMRIEGAGSLTVLEATASVAILLRVNSDAVEFRDITLDSGGNVTSYILQVDDNRSGFHADRCWFKDPAGSAGAQGFELRGGVSRTRFTECVFDGVQSTRINKDATFTWIDGCEFLNWWNYSIFVLADGTFAPSHIWITNNYFHSFDGSSTGPRQPIAVEGHATNHIKEVYVCDNDLVGTGTAWINQATANGGTADQISLHQVTGFIVDGNLSSDGGDIGITVSQSCQHGQVTNNRCYRNDVAGIAIGSASSVANHVVVTGNVCGNNGLDRNGDHPGSSALCGIAIRQADHCVVDGNLLFDDQATGTQKWGLTIEDCDNVKIGQANVYDGNTTDRINYGSGNTNVTGVWITFTPSFTNFTLGNAAVPTAQYKQIDDIVFVQVVITLGSTSSVSGVVSITPPVTAGALINGNASFVESGVGRHLAGIQEGQIFTNGGGMNTNNPFTWDDGDSLYLDYFYRAA